MSFKVWKPQEYQILYQRIVRLDVMVDEEYILANTKWREKIANSVHNASKVFENNFGITLVISQYRKFSSPNEIRDPFKFDDYMSNFSPINADVLVVFFQPN